MEPSFLLEGVAHPDRFLPPKHEYHCTQMAMRQLERLNGGYRPAYVQKDPILPQTGKLLNSHQTPFNINNDNMNPVGEVETCIDESLNQGVSWDNDRNQNYTDFSDGFLNTGNVSILGSSLDGENIWASECSNDSIGILSVTGSVIQYDPKSSADKNTSDDNIPSPFLQMKYLQLKDLDSVHSSVFSPPQEPSMSSGDVSLPNISIHSNPSVSHNAPRIIPTSVDLTGTDIGSLHVSELEHTVRHSHDFSLSYDNLLAQPETSLQAPACCLPVISKALRKKLPPGMARNPVTSSLLNSKCARPKDKESNILNLPPVLKILQQRVRYCGHIKTVPPAQVPGNHIDYLSQLRQRVAQQALINLPCLAGHVKYYGKAEPSIPRQALASEVLILPKLKR
ncbi:hypothetical protein GL50803_002217 [Giardia duodenalis]|uniref:Uncharacterized protein n=1 Tax=Giardia intestinalis (strain ATCC 50803 / WB clone C6) TaxID=184922 RepID=D3KGC8_GIAIC|nr:hypothetical protein GL50803_002217 [Giardia intestinalis]KAE8305098.1 hypothetical protein GL50803_002217 [Giardia intestinalis]